MVASNFQASLKLVLTSEGGNDDDPADHGGRTSRGITQREYTAWLAENHRVNLDVWKAPQSDIDTIYHDEYWNPWCDSMPIGIDYVFFNNSVLDGPNRAIKILQQSLGLAADGRIGPVTRAAFENADPTNTVIKMSDCSRNFYLSLHQPRFIKGWLNRVDFVKKNALLMIHTAPATT